MFNSLVREAVEDAVPLHNRPDKKITSHSAPEAGPERAEGTRPGGPVTLEYAASFVEDGGRSDFASSLLAAPAGPAMKPVKPTAADKMDISQAHADTASGDAIDTDLKILAKRMMGSIPELGKAAEEVGFFNQQIAELRPRYAEAMKKIQQHRQAETTDAHEQAEARNQERRWTKKKEEIAREILELENHKTTVIARVRDKVLRQALSVADKELGGVMLKAQAMRLDAEGVNVGAGADYVTHAVAQLRELTAQLEMAGNQVDPLTGKPAFGGLEQKALGELTALETRVGELRQAFGIERVWKPLEVDLEKDLVGLEQEAIGRNLDAAGAQAQALIDTLGFRGADYARRALDPASSGTDEMEVEVAAMESHLADAQRLLASLDPTLRAQFKGRVATVRQQVDKVYRQARRGRFDSIGIRTLPARMSEINETVKAAPAAPGRK
jgi:hypothetical protein